MTSSSRDITATVLGNAALEKKNGSCSLVFLVGGVLFGCVLVCASWGALDDFFLTSSSRDMTATVSSNAALEKKKKFHTTQTFFLQVIQFLFVVVSM